MINFENEITRVHELLEGCESSPIIEPAINGETEDLQGFSRSTTLRLGSLAIFVSTDVYDASKIHSADRALCDKSVYYQINDHEFGEFVSLYLGHRSIGDSFISSQFRSTLEMPTRVKQIVDILSRELFDYLPFIGDDETDIEDTNLYASTIHGPDIQESEKAIECSRDLTNMAKLSTKL